MFVGTFLKMAALADGGRAVEFWCVVCSENSEDKACFDSS